MNSNIHRLDRTNKKMASYLQYRISSISTAKVLRHVQTRMPTQQCNSCFCFGQLFILVINLACLQTMTETAVLNMP